MLPRVTAAVESLATPAADESWCDLTATDLLAAYASGADPHAVVDACFARIARIDSMIGAVMTLDETGALAAASVSAARWRAGTARPLEGVPFVVKDLLDTAGVRTTGGSRVFADRVPTADAGAVAAVRAAGAVMLAKTATYELGCGDEQGPFGVVANPWDSRHATGGSSSGSAAALAARMVPLALGTDTGGSIRIPSAWCGVVGLKPTLGRVPTDGLLALAPTLDAPGPMARTAEDVALLFGALTAPTEPASATRLNERDADAGAGGRLDGLTIGVAKGWLTEVLSADVTTAFAAALETLRGLGAILVPTDIGAAHHGAPLSWLITMAEASATYRGVPRDEMTAAFRGRLEVGDRVDRGTYLEALRARHVLAASVVADLAGVDAFVVPTCASAAPRLDDMDAPVAGVANTWPDVSARMVALWNVTGLPAVSAPIGFNTGGLPIGMQFVGRPFGDERLLALAAAYQAATEHHRAIPAISSSHPSRQHLDRRGRRDPGP
jgi:aspartyl-tRNA(Asn)/glutamyl-tRNA(Gln) amidotransferase subunit A